MHHLRRPLRLAIPVTLLLLSGASAEPRGEEPAEERRARFSDELLRTRPAGPDEKLREARHWRRIRLRKGAGLEVQRPLQVGERDLLVGVKGPIVTKKRLGVAFEVRF